MTSHAKDEVDLSNASDEKDSVGTYLAVGVAVLAGVGLSVLLPLKLNNKI